MTDKKQDRKPVGILTIVMPVCRKYFYQDESDSRSFAGFSYF